MQLPSLPSFAAPPVHKRVYSIIPLVLTVVSFSLIRILIQIGTTPKNYSDYPFLSLDTSGLRRKYTTTTSPGLPIHDVYNLYLRTHCEGYYWNNTKEVVGLECTKPAGSTNFQPGKLIAADLLAQKRGQTFTSIKFPPEIDIAFAKSYNPSLHAAFTFYIITLIFLGASLLSGLWFALVDAASWKIALGLTTIGDVALTIACVLTTMVQKQARNMVNAHANHILVLASGNSWFLAVGWLALTFGILAAVGWGFVGTAECKNE